jgi:hypothetical protein
VNAAREAHRISQKMKSQPMHPGNTHIAEEALESAKSTAKRRLGATAGATALVGGAAVGAKKLHDSKKEGTKESSVQFDIAAANLAVEKVAEAGWDPNEATNRINSLFNLGYEGDPEASEKVAAAESGEQALSFRACELLELAGYAINW